MTETLRVAGELFVSVLQVAAAVYIVHLRVKKVEEKITNNHSVHLRDDMDHKHDEQMGKLGQIFNRVDLLDYRLSELEKYSRNKFTAVWRALNKEK